MKLLNIFGTPSIRRRISSAFMIVTLFVVVMVAVSYFQLRQVRPFSDAIIHDSSDLVNIQSLSAATSALDADLERFLLIQGAEYKDSVQTDLQDMTDSLALLQKDPITGTETVLAELETTLAELQGMIGIVLDPQFANMSSANTNRSIITIYKSIDQIKLQQKDLSAKTLSGLQTTAQTQGLIADNVLTQSMILGIIVSLIAIVTTIVTDRSLRTIGILTNTAVAIAAGDLSRVTPVESNDEIGTLAASFNSMTTQLRELIGSLEGRVTNRTKALATSSEVSRRLSTILNRKELVAEVVDQVNKAFGYYHTQIYFYDEVNENLVMAGGTGEAGEMMLAQFHKVASGRGLVGRAAEKNQAVLVSNTLQNTEWLPNVLLPDTKSEVAIPISIGDRVLGVLDVQHNITDGLQQEDIDSLQSIANQVAVALQNIQSTEIVAKRAEELQTVAVISTAAATIGNIDDMLQEVVHLTQRGFGLYHAHVFTYNEDTAELEIAACGYKEGDEHEGTHGTTIIPLAQEQSLVARAGRTRQAVIVNDVRNEAGWLPNPLLPDTASELAVPLIVGDQLLGVLDVQSDRLNAFSDEDASIQSTLASQVATALQNARSFSQSQRQSERETAVNLITRKIQNTTSIEAALQITARELGHALGMKSTLVTLNSSAMAAEKKGTSNE